MAELEQFETFRVFNTKEQASAIAITLQNNGIEVVIDANTQSGGLLGDASSIEIPLKIKRSDFAKAEEILGTIQSEIEYEGNEDHPFFQFSNDELIEVINAPFEWEAYDYKLALNLLRKKDINFSDEQLKQIREKQLDKLAQPAENKKLSFSGYFVLSLGFLFIIGSFILMYQKFDGAPFYCFVCPMLTLVAFSIGKSCIVNKTLPNGNKVPQYTEKCRAHGRVILRLTALMLVLSILIIVLTLMK